MALLIPAGLFIIVILCCVGIALAVVRERNNARKTAIIDTQTQQVQQEKLVQQTQQQRSSQPSSPEQASITPQQGEVETKQNSSRPTTTPLAPNIEKTSEPLHDTREPLTTIQKPVLSNLPIAVDMGQFSQVFQGGRLSTEWWREQVQEISVKVQDMREQSGLVERHIAILNQIAVNMAELEQIRDEYTRLRERRLAVLSIPKQLQEQHADGDMYINMDKHAAMSDIR